MSYLSGYPRVKLLTSIVAIFIIVQSVNSLTAGGLTQFGLVPRTEWGLLGIFFAPFIHGSWEHLLSNLPPFIILSALLLHRTIKAYILASLFIIIVGGLAVWLIGRNAAHIGASGWVFGLWGLLIAQGFFRRKWGDIAIALLVLFYFGTMASGLLPTHLYISTESHIAGAIAGAIYAWLSHRYHQKTNNRSP
ncbi:MULTISPECIES: rhomboid family intramembrane serine protease [Providencia]|uniref:rhomboid family intramembrane serine protease n=1 Tax=Providencia TaxID=586 RepID=UPI001B3740C5|nr:MULTISPECIES: rhomboid family intramembrane serine protease [Providencia]MBQ0534234.1 rhomboid family intramembrane serine protease [Providencia huaxiensis]MBQ0587680.1 rhomboid family intramembrane serine protease [Providencia huaxiensis]MDI7240647.1 rhomboid family intramembrane serine protease [Providencia huaxiensis]